MTTAAANEALVRSFFGAWERGDLDAIVDAFAETGVYHNVPLGPPIEGRAAIRRTVAAWLESLDGLRFRLDTVIATQDEVVVEHADLLPTTWGLRELPVLGRFVIVGGEITLWREYFDLGQMRAMTEPPATDAASS